MLPWVLGVALAVGVLIAGVAVMILLDPDDEETEKDRAHFGRGRDDPG